MGEDSMDENVNFNSLLLQVGGAGRFTRIQLVISAISCILSAFSHISVIYVNFPPTFHCAQESLDSNDTCLSVNNTKCVEFIYDDSVMQSTVVTEWDLVCDRKALLPTLTFTYFLGIVFSILTSGFVSDHFGRKKLVVGCTLIHIIASWTAYLSPSYMVFLIARMFLGGSIHSVWAGIFVIVQESTPRKNRTFTSAVMNSGWNFGSLILCLIAYSIRDWRNIQLTFSVFSLLLLTVFFTKESARWLILQGRYEEAKTILKELAKINQVTLDEVKFEQDFDKLTKERKCDTSSEGLTDGCSYILKKFFQLVLTPEMRKRTLLLAPTFFGVGMASYGIHFATRFANLDIFAVSAIKESVALITILILMNIYTKLSRTKCLAFFFALGGVAGIAFMLVPASALGGRAVLLVVAQAIFIGDFFLLDTYAPELMPTSIRNFGFNLMDSISKVGSAVAPYVVDLGGEVNPGIPPAVFGVIMLFVSINFYFLPETQGRALPLTVGEVERDPGLPILSFPRRQSKAGQTTK